MLARRPGRGGAGEGAVEGIRVGVGQEEEEEEEEEEDWRLHLFIFVTSTAVFNPGRQDDPSFSLSHKPVPVA